MACHISTAFSFQAAGIAAGMHGWCAVGVREVEAMGPSAESMQQQAQAACIIDPAYGNAASASLPTDSNAASLWIPWKPAHLPQQAPSPQPFWQGGNRCNSGAGNSTRAPSGLPWGEGEAGTPVGRAGRSGHGGQRTTVDDAVDQLRSVHIARQQPGKLRVAQPSRAAMALRACGPDSCRSIALACACAFASSIMPPCI